ncbi:lipopolysaccharide transport periplasmic protein LptA [Pelomonas sp. SE-A7]|uniref:lipopolysaccharide transport periplasmic protein LptA n=1 Tax=Pelomonas sp. SE-A7 TaxID=3054953 RepID=UPI00259D2624|nr:lipopolysaccharide transport periplasmic protein LptA [Pelomonas sp. SE-A7]MDM4766993.1 lipopolysaccharide transport periplasmic protein LptA [Pelomonas sp. SE-A7]
MRLPALPSALPLLLTALLVAAPVGAAKGDRERDLSISHDEGGRAELANQLTEFTGNVQLSQGSLLLRAHRLQLRETPDGFFQANATAKPGEQVSFKQDRDKPGESIEGFADQIDYDGKAETVRFTGNAVLRQLRNGQVFSETVGSEFVYDNRKEEFLTKGGAHERSPNGRVRHVFTPRLAAEAAASAASSPAVPLKPSSTLQTAPRKPQ